jgi:hypothetical protein
MKLAMSNPAPARQHNRQADLRRHQRATETLLAGAPADRAAAIFQPVHEIARELCHAGYTPMRKPVSSAKPEGEHQHRRVERNAAGEREIIAREFRHDGDDPGARG